VNFDIFMIAFGEANAAENWQRLKAVAPEARLIDGVSGTFACYAACAKAARTPYFFTVDADNWILDGFRFEAAFEPDPGEIASWAATNPINGVSYGHGSIKLFPTALFPGAEQRDLGLDFVLTLGARNRFVTVPASEHRFNTDPHSTWATAFRESVKLVIASTTGGRRQRAAPRRWLETWCNQGEAAPFGRWCIQGAREGRSFGIKYRGDSKVLQQINDYAWMRRLFVHLHGDEFRAAQSNPPTRATRRP
jgi:hypothetical protein